ncbi:hypothetical protein [Actinophytocola algeriensis]|uniref:Transmembrane protein n=1 Tax=Actinophytocola algeriensis TaxID=1768010 RepID=A0A7W7QE44_9PSEU|nr:hypothetical protein [Actinophytocola algeriensis]MBB4911942.1 hypothetical protein [Actinophytocola algeriensis]MBE1477566.1 hypothetical protein [Actinophytocola algeriensis]
MTIVIRLLQQVLLLLAVGAAVTAFLVGAGVVEDVDTCVLTPEDGDHESCGQYEAQASAAFAIGSSGVAAALVVVALNGMVRPKTQVQAPQYPQQPSGAYPHQPH